MKPAPFDYIAPQGLDEVLVLLDRHGDGASLLAGGQTLVPLLNMRLARPDTLIDLNRIPELAGIRLEGAELCIGAMTRHMTLEHDPLVRDNVPLMSEAAGHIAHLQIRTRGTIGGSLAAAASAAEWPAVMAALEARLMVRAAGSRRTLIIDEFFDGPMATALRTGEILVEIRVPVPRSGTGWGFVEFARRHGDFALAGAAALVALEGDGSVANARLALCGMARPGLRLREVEGALVGATPDAATLDRIEILVRDTVDAAGDVQLGRESRRQIAGVMARRSLELALQRVGIPSVA